MKLSARVHRRALTADSVASVSVRELDTLLPKLVEVGRGDPTVRRGRRVQPRLAPTHVILHATGGNFENSCELACMLRV